MRIYNLISNNGLLKKTGLVLDLGSGSGTQSLPFFENGFSVTLVDTDTVSIEKAKGIFLKDTKFYNEDIKTFLQGNQQDFDVVIINNVLPFIKNPQEILKMLPLKSGGVLWATFFGKNDEWNVASQNNISFYTKEEVKDMLNLAGFAINFFSESEGMSPTIKGPLKFWHRFEVLCVKK